MKRHITFLLCALLGTTIATGCGDDITQYEVVTPEGEFPDYGEALAFPGAVGFGRYASGGRGGEVYHEIGRAHV